MECYILVLVISEFFIFFFFFNWWFGNQEINFQHEGHVLHYGQQLQNCTLRKVWNELKSSCNFSKCRETVNKFNCQNRWRKRGVAMIPTKFGISFTAKHMNQVTGNYFVVKIANRFFFFASLKTIEVLLAQ